MEFAYLRINCMRVGFKWRLDPASLHPSPVDRIEPGMDLDLDNSVSSSTTAKSVGRRLL